MELRPSALPKLALCGQYQGKPHASAEAARGTIIDGAFRGHAMGLLDEWPDGITKADAYNITWATYELRELADGAHWTAADDECHLQIPGMPNGGTVDALCLDRRWSADIKTGQHRDYRAQMAAYALGGMERTGYDQWDTYIVWIDDPQIERITWTRHRAQAMVRQATDNVGMPPKVNDYCGWCAKSLTCPARVSTKDAALAAVDTLTVQDSGFLALLNDPERLGQFLAACQTLDDFRDAAKEKARQLLEAGEKVPGWRLQKPRASEYLEAKHLAQAVQNGVIGAGDAIRAQGSISVKKAQQVWSAAGAVFPEELVQRKVGQAPLVAVK